MSYLNTLLKQIYVLLNQSGYLNRFMSYLNTLLKQIYVLLEQVVSLNHSPVDKFLFRKCIFAAYSETHFKLILIMEANTMNTSQTAPKGSILFAKRLPKGRPPDKSAYWEIIFFISHPKHMLWVLKRTVSLRRFF